MEKLKLNIQLFAATNTISCSQISRDIENNKSVQKITTKFTRTGGTTYWQDAKTITFKCTYQNDDGTSTTLTKTTTFSFPSGTVGMTKSVSVEFEIPHKSDGSQTISYSSSIATGTSMGTMTASGSSTLSTIPRASKVSCTSGNIEDTLAIIIEKYSDSFTSTITYQIGTVTGTIATKSSAPSFALNTSSIADSIYEQIPNDTSIKGTITCTTFNGDTQIGESTNSEFTLSVNKDKNLADVSVSFVDTNTSIKSLTGSDKKFIKYFSKPKVTVTATGKNYAAIKSYKISMSGGSTYNTSEVTFNEMLSNVITVTVTDSRGFPKVIPCTLDMVEYKKIICTGDVDRPEETSLDGVLNAEISYFQGSFGSVNNQLLLKAQYKRNGASSWTDIGTINYTSNNGKIILSNYSLGKLFDYNYEYIIRIVAEDSLMILNTDIPFQKGTSPLEVGDDLVNVNGTFTVNDENVDNMFLKQSGGAVTGNLQVDGDLKAEIKAITNGTVSIHDTLQEGHIRFLYNVNSDTAGLFGYQNNANAIMHISKHAGSYDSQVGFSSNGKLYYRSCNAQALSSRAWNEITLSRFLYNSAGTNSNITLSDDVSKYTYIEIFGYDNDNEDFYIKVYNPNGKTTNISSIKDNGTYTYVKSLKLTINGTTINRGMIAQVRIGNSVATTRTTDTNSVQFYITRVVGHV